MKYLVTGGCGFVGAALCHRLRAESAENNVTVIDNHRRRGSESNRAALERIGVRVVHGDVRLPSDIDAVGPFDWVIDAAAEPSVLAGTGTTARGATRLQLVEHNLVGTINLLEAAAGWNSGVAILSTSRVYSIPAMVKLPLVETCDGAGMPAFQLDVSQPLPAGASGEGIAEQFDTSAPVSLYGATKLASELLAQEYAFAAGTPLIIDRCGVMAGAGQFGRTDQGIFSWWIHSWAAKRPLSYIGFGGRGLQVRDCLHPADLGDLLVRQLAAARGGVPELMNVSGGIASARSLAQLSNWCAGRFGPHPVGSASETRPYDLAWVALDHGLVTHKYGWKPARVPEAIFEEIAEHALRNPFWLHNCG
jgi:CDP-paratose 2-epimerase